MPQKYETPADEAGARGDLLGGWSRETSKPAAPRVQFSVHRQAALALLNGHYPLTRKAGQFLGQLAVDASLTSHAQAVWLDRLLAKHGLPPLLREAGQ